MERKRTKHHEGNKRKVGNEGMEDIKPFKNRSRTMQNHTREMKHIKIKRNY